MKAMHAQQQRLAGPSMRMAAIGPVRRPTVLVRRGRRSGPPPAAGLGWLAFWKRGAAAAPVAAAPVLLAPEAAFTGATVLVLPVYFAMIAFPGARLTRQVLDSPLIPLLLGVPYAILLWQAWQAGALAAVVDAARASSPLPDANALAAVFKGPALTALAWLHLLLLDLLQARAVLLDGLRTGVPTPHSVALCCMFGPLGVLCHLVTRWVVAKARGGGGSGISVLSSF